MKRIIIPAVVMLIIAAALISLGTFSSDGKTVPANDRVQECSQSVINASIDECTAQATKVIADTKECGPKSRTITASDTKECGADAAAVKASEKIECPHSGAVLRTAENKESCGEKNRDVHASVESEIE